MVNKPIRSTLILDLSDMIITFNNKSKNNPYKQGKI